MDFSDALRQLKRGKRITQAGNPLNWFLFFVPAQTVHVKEPPLSDFLMQGAPVGHNAHIMKRNVDGSVGPWVPTMDDLLSQWELLATESEEEPRLFTFPVANEQNR